jgi:hypothetical protein
MEQVTAYLAGAATGGGMALLLIWAEGRYLDRQAARRRQEPVRLAEGLCQMCGGPVPCDNPGCRA